MNSTTLLNILSETKMGEGKTFFNLGDNRMKKKKKKLFESDLKKKKKNNKGVNFDRS